MVSGKRFAASVGAGGAVVGLGYFLWKRFRPRGMPTQEQWDAFAGMGDVNRDGYINTVDIDLVTAAFMATPGSPNWNPACDLNKDSILNLRDLAIVALYNGLNIWDFYCL